MMDFLKQYGLWILGGIVLLYIIVKYGANNSSGVSWQAPDPNAVASVENATSNDILANNALLLGRAQIGANLVSQLAGYNEQLALGTVNANAQVEQTQLTTAAGVQVAQIGATQNEALATTIAQSNLATQEARNRGAVALAATNANAATAQASNASGWGFLGTLASSFMTLAQQIFGTASTAAAAAPGL